MKNENQIVKDLVLDENFQSWVLHPNDKTNAYWNRWLKNHPQCEGQIQEARDIVLLLQFTEDTTANQDLVDVWSKIKRDVNSQPLNLNLVWRLTAVFAVLAMLVPGYFLFFNHTDILKYSSEYGEIKNITLPDGSEVTLNGNTQLLLYKSDWQESINREVFLEGEAFFEVKHITDLGTPRKFMVHTNELDIEVLGTTFNVTSRHEETKVLLNTGKVQLKLPENADVSEFMMNPGDLVTFNKKKGNAVVDYAESPEMLTQWRNNQLIFDGTTLSEISQILKDTYGLEIRFSDDSLKEKKFRGTFLTDDIDILKEVLTQTYNIKIIENAWEK